MNDSSCIFEIIDQTIKSSQTSLPVKELCQIAGVSRSGYYAWVKAAPVRAQQEQQDREDFELVLSGYKMHGYSKGARGIRMALEHMNPPVIMNLKKIRRLMDKFNLSCPIRKANPYRRMAKALKTSNVADNLLKREFECYGPRMVLLTDITFLPYNGRFAYLSTILDAFTKQVLSYVISDSLEVDFVLETVNQLIEKHGISLHAETIIHSDQGCHYTSYRFIQLVKDKNLRQSMSRRGNCWDNAPQESFHGHMKDHIREKLRLCTQFAEVKDIVDEYIDTYNNYRYQWDLAKLSPNEFYQFCITGVYPLDVPNKPPVPTASKPASELGAGAESRDSTPGAPFAPGQPLTE
ncbi:MAG: IS3 family transposase [Agathobacter sp.]|jgi:transposase InsO family protein|nr:IS3 family transposase [Agathobacter sp.]MEE0900939.1 IS3 family transposase [Methanobrevibacter sp.]